MTAGPRTATHRLDPAVLDAARVRVGPGGVLLGFHGTGTPVTIQLFRGRPTQVATVCGGYTARVLAFRALAVGAAVEVAATAAGSWSPLLDLKPAGATTLVPPAGDPAPGSGPRRPLLRCEEVAPAAVRPRSGLSVWQTRVVVPTSVTVAATAALTGFDLVLLRRLPPDAVHPVQLAFDLPDQVAARLSRLPADGVLALADGQAVEVALGLTPLELSVLGPPSR
jgi:hypothetical protein